MAIDFKQNPLWREIKGDIDALGREIGEAADKIYTGAFFDTDIYAADLAKVCNVANGRKY